jgi:hypothetical protein
MSRSVDLFIAARHSLDEVAAELTQKLELTARMEADGSRYLVTHEGVAMVLHRHPYVDDEGLPFSRYPYALSASVRQDARPQDSTEAAVLRRLAQRIQQALTWPVLLVLDLQFRDAALHPGGQADTDREPAPATSPAGIEQP